MGKSFSIEKQLFKLHDFAALEDAEKVIGEFIELYNNEWMLESIVPTREHPIKTDFRGSLIN